MTSPKVLLKTPLEVAAAPARLQIEVDKEKVPDSYQEFLRIVDKKLFEEKLGVQWAASKAGIRDNSFSSLFKDYVGESPGDYILNRRMEVAERLLRDFNYQVGAAGAAVGIPSVRTFRRCFKAWSGELPSDVRGKALHQEIDPATLRRAGRGELDLGAGREVVTELRRFYPDPLEPGESVLDGPAHERRRAAKICREIRELPFVEQRPLVRWHPFRTTALFDLLRVESRREGRKDRELGIRLAELALDSLEGCGEASGERYFDLRAEGLAWLGRCRRQARDFSGAEADFVAAWASWRVPRSKPEPRMVAEIYLHHGTLRMFQRQYDEALELIQESLTLFEREGDTRCQIQALIQRASVRGYCDELEEAILDLNTAAELVDEHQHRHLAFNIYRNLANAHGRAGASDLAFKHLEISREHLAQLDYPLGEPEIKWLEASIREIAGQSDEADSLYRESHNGLTQAGEASSVALLSLDWSALCSEEGRHAEVLRLMSEALPILESYQFHPETLAGLALVSQAIKAGEISTALLRDLQAKLRSDPWVLLI